MLSCFQPFMKEKLTLDEHVWELSDQPRRLRPRKSIKLVRVTSPRNLVVWMLSRSVLRLVQMNSNETLFATASVRQPLWIRKPMEILGHPGTDFFLQILFAFFHTSKAAMSQTARCPEIAYSSGMFIQSYATIMLHLRFPTAAGVRGVAGRHRRGRHGWRLAGSESRWIFLGILASKYRRNVRKCHEMLDVTSGCEDMGYGEMWWHDSHDHQNNSKCKKTIQNIIK